MSIQTKRSQGLVEKSIIVDGPQITENQIKHWVGEKIFGRGRDYYRNGAIFNARKTGLILKSECLGQSEESYSVRITCTPKTIKNAVCICPFEDGVGRCKHVAALLLTWLNDPNKFVGVESMEKLLEGKSDRELTELILDLVDEQPRLEITLIRLVRGEEALAELLH